MAKGNTAIEKLHLAWDALQYNVNNILDKQGRSARGEQGLKQVFLMQLTLKPFKKLTDV